MIELILAIVVSFIVIGTYLRFFTHSVKLEAHNTLKSGVALRGQNFMDSFENIARLTGLANSSDAFRSGWVITAANGNAASVTAGNYTAGTATFTFQSPFGGAVTKVLSAQGSLPNCTITVQNSASLYAGMPHYFLINRDNIYTATVSAINNNQITATVSPTPVGISACGDAFPSTTLVTGPNREYTLAFNDTQRTRLTERVLPSGSAVQLFDAPREEIPFFLLQFLTETVDNNNIVTRQWLTSVTGCNSNLDDAACKTIKAVRFAFVMAARQSRDASGGTAPNEFSYCFFDDYCFEAPVDTDRRYLSFSRVIYLRNFDSLQRNLRTW
jgi:hypothetical protein